MTPVFPPEEGHRPRNYELSDGKVFYNHMPSQEVHQLLGESAQNYLFWCVERHPIDKCISHFAMIKNSPYHNQGNEGLTWQEYVDKGTFPVDASKWHSNGKTWCHKIFDYCSISRTILAFLRNEFQITKFNLDSRAKSGFRRNGIPTISDVTPTQRKRIMNSFSESSQLLRSFGILYE